MRNDTCARNAALHEILHLWRYYVIKIPQLMPRDHNANPRLYQMACVFDNEIEHSVICPLQISLGHTSEIEFWRKQATRIIGEIPNTKEQASARFNIAMHVISYRWKGIDIRDSLRRAYALRGYGRVYDSFAKKLSAFEAKTANEKLSMVREVLKLTHFDKLLFLSAWFANPNTAEIPV